MPHPDMMCRAVRSKPRAEKALSDGVIVMSTARGDGLWLAAHQRMSMKATLISVLAAGAALTVVGLAIGRPSFKRAMVDRLESRRGGKAIAPPVHKELRELTPREMVLPLAFWDAAAELDTEDELPSAAHALGTADEPYDSIDTEDASVTWLARATESGTRNPADDVDDPAEIAADSLSMVSEASRAAAGGDPHGFESEPDTNRGS